MVIQKHHVISIIIPAHNEEAVIARGLRAIVEGAAPGELEVIVVCNGCSDRTAAIARGIGGPVRVLEIATASKVMALNAGDKAASGFPRLFVDADVVLPLQSVRLIASALQCGDALAAWPEPRTDLSRASWPVRAYYAVWLALPYNRDGGRVGSGVYTLSREGRARFDRFPDVINDDGFVRFRFAPGERLTVPGAYSMVEPPRSLGALVRVKTRVRAGQYELRERFSDSPAADRKSPSRLLGMLARRPALLLALPVYVGVTLLVRWRARRRIASVDWARDMTTRAQPTVG
jgi:glycosyltransferase involved in cell wall biosynthesis